jgi:hypothetical protein
MDSYPSNELPLADLIRFAADNGLTASIDLRSRLTAGRIDIREGQVIDAQLGGLSAEPAVYAAMASGDLHVLRGRKPKRSAPRRIELTTAELLHEGMRRKSEPQIPVLGAMVIPSGSNPETVKVPNWNWASRTRSAQSRSTRLRLALFAVACLILTAALALVGWRSLARAVLVSEPVPFGLSNAAALVPVDSSSEPIEPPRLIAAPGPMPIDEASAQVQSLPVEVLVDEEGNVFGAKIDRVHPGQAAVEDAAIASVMVARFAPATTHGHPVTSWTRVFVGRAADSGVARSQR